jgi:hypothetical protein
MACVHFVFWAFDFGLERECNPQKGAKVRKGRFRGKDKYLKLRAELRGSRRFAMSVCLTGEQYAS